MVVSCDVWWGQTATAANPVTPPITSYQCRRRKISRDQTSRISVLGNAEASAYLQVNSGGVRAPSLLHWRSKGQWWRLVFISTSNEGYPKVRNHGEGLLLVESGYYRFHI